MPHLSVKMSVELYDKLIEKGQKIGIDNVSDTVRILLLWALENQEGSSNSTLLHRTASYSVMVHSLIEECMLSLVESGSELWDKAHAKADKLIAEMSENSWLFIEQDDFLIVRSETYQYIDFWLV